MCDLLDAAGFDRILIETVGVGQSELDVARMADTTVLVLVPESGDGIQTLKAGVMEIADVFVVNKADRPGADQLRQEIEVMLGIRRGNAFRNMPAHHGVGRTGARRTGARTVAMVRSHRPRPAPQRLTRPAPGTPPVLLTVAAKGEGIAELVAALDRHLAYLSERRRSTRAAGARLRERTREVVDRATRRWIWDETRAERADRRAAGRGRGRGG